MSEQDDTQEATPDTSPIDEAYVARLREESKRYRLEAKKNADAAKKLAEIEDANKSELDRMQQRATEAEARVTALELEVTRTRIAAEKGLTPELAKRLQGQTPEEIEADADALMALLPPAPQRPPGRPVEELQAGTVPVAQQTPTDKNALLRQMFATQTN